MGAFLRKYGTGSGADVYVTMVKRAVVDHAVSADWTPAAGDVKISLDGGTAANIGTLPAAIAMGNSAIWKFVFADAELQGKAILVTIADSATKAVEDNAFAVETYGHASAMYQADLSAANLPANIVQILGTTLTETAGQIAGGVKKFFNVATPTGTVNSIPDAVAGATGGLAIVGSAMTLTASAVQAIWDALTSALLTAGSIGKLLVDNINATISSRLASASYTAPDNAGITAAAASAASAATSASSADSKAAAIQTKTDNLPADPASNTQVATRATPAQVNAEVLDVLSVDTFSQPGQESPAATTTLAKMLSYLFKAWRNKHTQTGSEYALYADDGITKDQEAAVTDDGTTFTRNEIQTGA